MGILLEMWILQDVQKKIPVQILLQVIKEPSKKTLLFVYSYKVLLEIVFKNVLPMVRASVCLYFQFSGSFYTNSLD